MIFLRSFACRYCIALLLHELLLTSRVLASAVSSLFSPGAHTPWASLGIAALFLILRVFVVLLWPAALVSAVRVFHGALQPESAPASAGPSPLRAVSEGARSDDDRGISRGPFAWQCDGGAGPMATVFVNSDPAFMVVASPRSSLTMWRARSASGAKYDGPGGALFWEHQGQARFREPGATAEVTCTPDRRNP